MKIRAFARLASVLAFASLLTAPSLAQPVSPPPGYPNWTGAQYPPAQHLSIMLLHLDEAALAMARTAQRDAKSASTKQLSANVVAERTRDIASIRSSYAKQYGQQPPAWPAAQNGYGPGMMYGPGTGGYGGMMGGNGGMMGGDNQSRGAGRTMFGPMMGYGDTYQMMMGGRANWWGSSNVDTSFASALMRLDAMEISMATLGLTASDPSTKELSHMIVTARAEELSRLARAL